MASRPSRSLAAPPHRHLERPFGAQDRVPGPSCSRPRSGTNSGTRRARTLTRVSDQLRSPAVGELSEAYKQLNASVGQFGTATLVAATNAIVSSAPGDSTYLAVDRALQRLEAGRDSLATSIKNELFAAEFGGARIGFGTALGQTIQARILIWLAQRLASPDAD